MEDYDEPTGFARFHGYRKRKPSRNFGPDPDRAQRQRRAGRDREGEVFGAAGQRPARRLRRGLLPGERVRHVRVREGEVFGAPGRAGQRRRGPARVPGGVLAAVPGASFSRPPLRILHCPRLSRCLRRSRRLV